LLLSSLLLLRVRGSDYFAALPLRRRCTMYCTILYTSRPLFGCCFWGRDASLGLGGVFERRDCNIR